MPSKAKTHEPYPYDIPLAPELDAVTLKNIDPWNALEFFRVEALLRSESVWALYRQVSQRKAKSDCPVERHERWKLLSRHVYKKDESDSAVPPILCDETLRSHFFIDDGWLVLWGAHHRYLRPEPWMNPSERSKFDISDGILDLSALARENMLDSIILLHNLQEQQKLFLYLKINCAVAPQANLKKIELLLRERHKALTIIVEKPNIDPSTGVHTFPFHPRKDPPITNVRAWLTYLQCYDLRQCQDLTYGQIARQIYGKQSARDKAEMAVRRVDRLIHAAEENNWPPKNLAR